MAETLTEAGYEIREIICRANGASLARARKLARKLHARACTARQAHLSTEVVWLFVPDASIKAAVIELSHCDWSRKLAFHASGVLPSDALQILRQRGASVASVHPLMTFVSGSRPQIKGTTFAIEGDAEAVLVAASIVRDLEGDILRIRKQNKTAYHAFATMICPLLVSLVAAAEDVASRAGLSSSEARRRMMPIIRQTLSNVEKLGPAGSFSGPLVRGDIETVRQHLTALFRRPAAKETYVALALAALQYLPNRNRKEMENLLQKNSAISSRRLRLRAVNPKERKHIRKERYGAGEYINSPQ